MANRLLIALALVLAATLTYFDKQLPAEAWIAVGVLGGVTVPRPGDSTATQLARELEATDPTLHS